MDDSSKVKLINSMSKMKVSKGNKIIKQGSVMPLVRRNTNSNKRDDVAIPAAKMEPVEELESLSIAEAHAHGVVPSTGKWVPPHLRASSTGKWVLPYKRHDASAEPYQSYSETETDDDEMFDMGLSWPSSPGRRSRSPKSGSSSPVGFLASSRLSQSPKSGTSSSPVGVTSLQGNRAKMEDRCVSLREFGGKEQSFYAVYDGHCGIQAAQYAAEKLHTHILKHPKFKTDCKRAVSEACRQIDQEFVELARSKKIYDGTTAVLAIIIKSHAVVATIGDSYCVLCRGGKAVELSKKLTPGDAAERKRIEDAGGWITEERLADQRVDR